MHVTAPTPPPFTLGMGEKQTTPRDAIASAYPHAPLQQRGVCALHKMTRIHTYIPYLSTSTTLPPLTLPTRLISHPISPPSACTFPTPTPTSNSKFLSAIFSDRQSFLKSYPTHAIIEYFPAGDTIMERERYICNARNARNARIAHSASTAPVPTHTYIHTYIHRRGKMEKWKNYGCDAMRLTMGTQDLPCLA